MRSTDHVIDGWGGSSVTREGWDEIGDGGTEI
jgi:hypothetical protein